MLTPSQLSALLVFREAGDREYLFEKDVCTRYVSLQLVQLGLIERNRSHVRARRVIRGDGRVKAPCHLCYGRGILRDRHTKRYERCPCGRLPDSWGARKLSTQHALDVRAESVRKGGAW